MTLKLISDVHNTAENVTSHWKSKARQQLYKEKALAALNQSNILKQVRQETAQCAKDVKQNKQAPVATLSEILTIDPAQLPDITAIANIDKEVPAILV